MEFTLTPKSPRTTIFLVVALVGSLIFVMTSGGKSKRRSAGGPVAVATQAAEALVNLAVPGPDAAAPAPPTTAGADTTFGDNPFLSTESTGNGFGAEGLRRDEADGGGGDSPASAGDGPGALAAGRGAAAPLRVSGTIIDGERRLALIGSRYYAPGQMVGEWRLTFVGPREARLERRGETITLRVGS